MEGFSFVTPVTGLNGPNTGKEEEEEEEEEEDDDDVLINSHILGSPITERCQGRGILMSHTLVVKHWATVKFSLT
jgi:hypothetical protein